MDIRFKRICERKLRASDAREEKALEKGEAEPDCLQPVPPLLVVLRKDLGKLPAGIVIEFESQNLALSLIRHGLGVAVPKGSFTIRPDLMIDDEQLLHAGLPLEFYHVDEVVCT
jgi:DNA-binding transcriptional LysR family regulator